jgi:potassium efflux system protein
MGQECAGKGNQLLLHDTKDGNRQNPIATLTAMTLNRNLYCLLLIVFFVLEAFIGRSSAAKDNDDFAFSDASLVLERIEEDILKGRLTAEELGHELKRVNDFLSLGSQCLKSAQTQLSRITELLGAIGPEVEGESREITQERKSLIGQKTSLEKRLAECRVLVLKAEDVRAKIGVKRRELLARRLFHREADFRMLTAESLRSAGQWRTAMKDFVILRSGFECLTAKSGSLLLLLLSFGAVSGFWLRLRLRQLAVARAGDSFSDRLIRSAQVSVALYGPFLLVMGIASVFMGALTYGITPRSYGAPLACTLTTFLFLLTAISAFLVPPSPSQQVVPLPPGIARSLARRLRLLALLSLGWIPSFTVPFTESMPQPAYGLAQLLLVTFFCLAFTWFFWALTRIPRLMKYRRWLRLVSTALLLSVLCAEWLGYHNLSIYLFKGMAGTFILAAALPAARTLSGELFDGLAHGRRAWQKSLRRKMGIADEEVVRSLIWFKFIFALLLWYALGLFFMRLWGISDAYFSMVTAYLSDGFQVGKVRIVPSRIITGLFLFILIWTVSSWLKHRLERKWLVSTQLALSARETLVTIFGYVGFTFAVIIGLSVAGVNFSGLALIAGALSVGIGFGLQNIVNNFVSGLILLFERPIKRGDWIVVGNTQGYVQKISIRSTIIQTFDRSDVIVPNSELISSQVTNYMLHDIRGRVIVPVGVAYGSDTGLVKELMLEVANSHRRVITDGSVPKPRVLFMEFGDSSLNFELRCFIRDIDYRLTTKSDLNFAIDATFRKHGIKIPFPQRDIHVQDWANTPKGEVPPKDT